MGLIIKAALKLAISFLTSDSFVKGIILFVEILRVLDKAWIMSLFCLKLIRGMNIRTPNGKDLVLNLWE